jgi:hypothetical protein
LAPFKEVVLGKNLTNFKRAVKSLLCRTFGHRKVEMTELEAYPAACGWRCARCTTYRLWQHASTQ